MSGSCTRSPRSGFPRRLAIAGVNLLVPLHTTLILAYYSMRWLGRDDLWYIDATSYVLPWLFVPLLCLLPAAMLRRSRSLCVLALIPSLLFLWTYGELFIPRRPVKVTGPKLTVMTHNVFYRNRHADRIVEEIRAREPDVVALQELGPATSQAVERHLVGRYPFHRVEPGCGIFSRHPIVEYEAFRLGQGVGAWAQRAKLDIDGSLVTVINVHPRSPPLRGFHPLGLPLGIPTGFDNEGRDADVRDLLARLHSVSGALVVLGDFNLTDRQDLYSALAYRLRDSHREGGLGMGFTFTRFPELSLPMWRIDYVFHSFDIETLCAKVGDFGGSDHRPVIARLGLTSLE